MAHPLLDNGLQRVVVRDRIQVRRRPGNINRSISRIGPELLIVHSQLTLRDLVEIDREGQVMTVSSYVGQRRNQIRIDLTLPLEVPLIGSSNRLVELRNIYVLCFVPLGV